MEVIFLWLFNIFIIYSCIYFATKFSIDNSQTKVTLDKMEKTLENIEKHLKIIQSSNQDNKLEKTVNKEQDIPNNDDNFEENCPGCGIKVSIEDEFCPSCGLRLKD